MTDPGTLYTTGQQLVSRLVRGMVRRSTQSNHPDEVTKELHAYLGPKAPPLIEELRTAYTISFTRPKDMALLRIAADTRNALERYVESYEYGTGKRKPLGVGRPRAVESKGYTVTETRHGRFRAELTSTWGRGHIGIYDTRPKADKVGSETVSKLRRAEA